MSAPGLYASDRKTAGELKVIGEQRGWKPKKELTLADVQRMGSLEMQFHEIFSPEAMKLAIEEPQRKTKAAKQRVSDMWGGKLGPEVDEAAHRAGRQFCEKYPQFIQDETNAWALHNFMKANGLDGTEVHSYVEAFQALAARGELHLNPSALGLGTEERISGHTVKTHPELHLLLRPALTPDQIEQYKSAKMSSAKYLKAHPELRDQRVPHYIQERANRAAATFQSTEPSFVADDDSIDALVKWVKEKGYEFNHNALVEGFKTLYEQGRIGRRRDAVVHGQVLTMTDYPSENNRGVPELPEKASLAAKIRNLSSSEFAQLMRDSPSTRKAVDAV